MNYTTHYNLNKPEGPDLFNVEHFNENSTIIDNTLYDHSQTLAPVSGHIANENNPHNVTKAQVGLGNVDNTSDANKPVSSAVQTELNKKVNSSALATVATTGSYNDLLYKPTLGTAASKDVPSDGDATSMEVVMGDDSRLSDSRPASDVSAWAKASTKPTYTASEVGAIATTDKGSNGGVAELDANGKVPSTQLPSYVDDVIEGYYKVADGKFYEESTYVTEITPEADKIYVDITGNKTYRWSGSAYVEIGGGGVALGETSTTAYRGDRGKAAYDHSIDSGAISSAVTEGLYKISGTAEGHIGSLTAVQKSDITSLGIPALENTIDSPTSGNTGGVVQNATAQVSNYSLNVTTVTVLPNQATGDFATAEGVSFTYQENGQTIISQTVASGVGAHAEGTGTSAEGSYAHAEGYRSSVASATTAAHAEGYRTTATANGAHAEGYGTNASNPVTASGIGSHAEGYSTTASGNHAHAEGYYSTATNNYGAHAEGYKSTASGEYGCHAEGDTTTASVRGSHSEGKETTASGLYSHAEGYHTSSAGQSSHASGSYTVAGYENQTAIGSYNSNKSTTLFEVGCGTSSTRTNAFEVYSDGSLSTNNGTTKTKLPVIKSENLAANVSTVTFTGMPTTGTNIIDFYITDGSNYTAINTATSGQVTLTYATKTTARTVYAVIIAVTS